MFTKNWVVWNEVIDSLLSFVPQIEYAQEVFKTEDSVQFIYGLRLLVRFADAVSESTIDSIALEYSLTEVRHSTLIPDFYEYSIGSEGTVTAIDIANSLDSLPQTLYAYPNYSLKGLATLSNYEPFDYYRDECRHVTSVSGN